MRIMLARVFIFVRRSSLAWGLVLAYVVGLLFGLLGGFKASPASQLVLVLAALLLGLLLVVGAARPLRLHQRFGLAWLVELALLLLLLVPLVLLLLFPRTLVFCLVVGWVAGLALGGPVRRWKALVLIAFLGSVAGLGLLGAYWNFLSWHTTDVLLDGAMLLLAGLGGALGGSVRWVARGWWESAAPPVTSSSLIPQDEADAAPAPAAQEGRLSRRNMLAGMGGVLGLAAAGGVLTWATRALSSYFVLPLLTYRGHQNFIESLCWSPDGLRIVSVGGEFTNSFLIWEASTGKTLFTAPTLPEGGGAGHSATWSPNGRWIAAEYSVGAATWDVASNMVLAIFPDIFGLVTEWSPDSTRLLSNQDGVIWEVATKRKLVTWQQAFSTFCAAWSPDGSRIASGGSYLDESLSQLTFPAQVVIWDAATGQSLVTYHGHEQEEGTVNCLAWSPDSRRIASVTLAGIVHVWEAASGRTLVLYRGHTGVVAALAWAPDGGRIASAGIDGTVQIWNPSSGECLFTYHGHNTAGSQGGGAVTAMAWSPDGRVIASGDTHATIQIWRPE